MDSFIKKIFDQNTDDSVHLQFQKFSKGKYPFKALIVARRTKDKYSIATTPEFVNDFVRTVAEKLKGKSHVTGVVVSARDLTGELEFVDKKQFMGVKRYIIDAEMSKDELIELCDKFPSSFLGLSFKTNDTELKIKPKAPKSAKPSTKSDEAPKVNFCRLITTDKDLVKGILFDVDLDKFKKAEINHTFVITSIEPPKGEKDPVKFREKAVRKGKVIRHIVVDGDVGEEEMDFEA